MTLIDESSVEKKHEPLISKKKDVARESVFLAAKGLFLEFGYSAVSMIDIAKHASVNKSLIFYHFKSKLALWNAVTTQLNDEMDVFYADLFSSTSLGRSQLLNMVFDKVHTFYDQHPDYIKMLCWQLVDESPLLQQTARHTLIKSLKRVIRLLQKSHRLRSDLDPEVIEMVLLSGAFGPFFLNRARSLTRKQKQQYVEFMMESLNRALSFKRVEKSK